MKLVPVLLAASLALVGLSLPGAEAASCVTGNDPDRCLVSVQWVVCVTEPCDGMIVCLLYGKVCSNRILP